jgi:Xaa-Pro aminopeptidase
MRKIAKYRGDAGLARLLDAAHVALTVDEVRARVAGIAAAPPPVDPESWLPLIAVAAPRALAGQLLALCAELRSANSGLGQSPAPADRLAALRGQLKWCGVDGFLVPVADEHQGEFTPLRARRLAWLSGYRGSAGLAVVLMDRAAIFVDGRYTLQVRDQVDTGLFSPHHLTEQPPADWVAENLTRGAKLGYDPWLHTADGLAPLGKACGRANAGLVPLDHNPIDTVWRNQPPPPLAPVVPHGLEFAGRDTAEKVHQITAGLATDGVDAVVLSAPDSIAWLLNIRGGDAPHSPVAHGFAILHADGALELFMDPRKLTAAAYAHLGNRVTVRAPPELGDALDGLGAAGKQVQVAAAAAPAWIVERLTAAGAELVRRDDPCALPKACKNSVELSGMRAAHLRDGAALTRFLAWLAEVAPAGGIDELAAADKLAACRAGAEHFRGLSFDTISGAGSNGAVVHYHATPETNRKLAPGTLYLVDSGAQYLDGTTDVTRTIAIGKPAPEMRDRFTRVLKGHMALAMARFPAGTSGGQLDALARTALWQAGLDFDHGTGHGVGSYLNVHEGPQRIAKRGGGVALRPGMVVSNEPGYYKPGAYGIRIENLVVVRRAELPEAGQRDMLEFETLTLAPIDRNLVEISLLTGDETVWLNAYHARVRTALTPLVNKKTARWLKQATATVG